MFPTVESRGGPSIGHGCTHANPTDFANEIEVSRIYCIVPGSDPNTNSFVRVWGAPSRTAEGKRRGGHTWWMLVAGKGAPVAAAREGKPREGRVRGRRGEETEMSLRP